MQNIISRFTLAAGLAAALLLSPLGHTLEGSANTGDVSGNATEMKIRAATAALKTALDAALACNAKEMLFAPKAPDADADGCRALPTPQLFDPAKLYVSNGVVTNYERLGHSIIASGESVIQLCIENGFNGQSGSYGTDQYDSPSDNRISQYNKTTKQWQVIGAKAGPHVSGPVPCFKYGLRD